MTPQCWMELSSIQEIGRVGCVRNVRKGRGENTVVVVIVQEIWRCFAGPLALVGANGKSLPCCFARRATRHLATPAPMI